MADGMIGFAEARLAEDQAAAETACLGGSAPRPGPFREWHIEPWSDGEFLADGRTLRADLWARPAVQLTGQGALDTGIAAHIVRHDPARALRDVAAGRRILARHRDCWGGSGFCGDGGHCDDDGCGDMLDLVARWSDHPDYDPAWKADT